MSNEPEKRPFSLDRLTAIANNFADDSMTTLCHIILAEQKTTNLPLNTVIEIIIGELRNRFNVLKVTKPYFIDAIFYRCVEIQTATIKET